MSINPPTTSEARSIIERSARDPAWFFREILGNKPWLKQVEIMEAVRDYKEVAIRSCHGIGKDWVAARIVLWFLYSHAPALVITTGPTDRQVKGILWREIAHAHARAKFPLGGQLLTQEIRLSPDRWAIGFTAGDDPDRFQGFHCKNVLVVIDEASGVNKSTYTAVEAILSSENAHKLEIGNPTDPISEFSTSFKTPGIHKMTVDAFETPNLTEFGIIEEDIKNDTWEPKITGPLPMPELITPEWVSKRYKRWHPTNPLYVSRVRAQFPDASEDTLIPLKYIEAAQERTLEPGEPNILGVDVARFGSDYTVIMHRRGPVLRTRMRLAKSSTMETAGYVQRELKATKARNSFVDVVGLGAGVVDKLKEEGCRVIEANAGSSPLDKEMFANARAEWFWRLREAFESGAIDISPDDEDLSSQLAAIKWKPDSKGRVTIESKEDMRRRGVSSPDDADAASMTFSDQNKAVDSYKQAMNRL